MRFLFTLLLTISLSLPALSQTDTLFGYGYLTPIPDTLTTAPGNGEWQQLTGNKAYDAYKNEVEYKVVTQQEKKNLQGESLLLSLLRFFGSTAGKIILLLLIGSLIIWFGYRYFRQHGQLFYNNKKFDAATTQEEGPEDLLQDWSSGMQQAAAQQDYRMAIRFGYLWLLQIMDENEWITYHPNKTNRDYAGVLQQPDIRESFLTISRLYERNWYGYQNAGKADFELFQQHLLTLESKGI